MSKNCFLFRTNTLRACWVRNDGTKKLEIISTREGFRKENLSQSRIK
jgi:hypothetical protein